MTAEKLIKMSSVLGVAVGILMVCMKSGVYFATGSLVVMASLVDSITDIINSFVNYLCTIYSLKPSDDNHRFGHNAIEDIAGISQSFFIAGSVFFVIAQSVERLIAKDIVTFNKTSIIVMVVSLILTLCLVAFQRFVIKKTNSLIVKVDLSHYKSDILMNGGVLVSILIVEYTKLYWVDSVIACFIGIYVFYSAYTMSRESFNNLMDKEIPDFERLVIEEKIRANKNVISFHDLKTRRSGSKTFIQCNIKLDPNLSLVNAHDICEEVEKEILRAIPNSSIIIHKEPVS
jgi:ferrous-iron efflux pump FieF